MSQETIRLSSARPRRIPPPTGAVTIGGRLGAIGVNGQVLLLRLGLEIGGDFLHQFIRRVFYPFGRAPRLSQTSGMASMTTSMGRVRSSHTVKTRLNLVK